MLSKCKVIVFKFQEKTLKGKMQVGEKASKHTWNIYIYIVWVCACAHALMQMHTRTHTHFISPEVALKGVVCLKTNMEISLP